jgi:hypothetical protein
MVVMEDRQPAPLELVNAVDAERLIAAVVKRLDPATVATCDVTAMWQAFDRIERLGASAKMLLAARVEGAGTWRRAGARSAADHLAKLGGTSTLAARRALEHSKELPSLPGVSEALRAGNLSNAQIDAIVPAAAADRSAEDRLVGFAQTTNVTELKGECLRTRAAADRDPDTRYARIRAARSCRTFTDDEGAWNLVARGTADCGAAFETALGPIITAMFTKARHDRRHEPREAYAFDALMTLAEADDVRPEQPGSPNPRYFGLLRVDVEAMLRGAIEGEETCEIVGVGPVPVRVARELLGDAILKLVITRGVDVVNVTHLGRGATAAQRVALLWAKPKCANVACSSTLVQLDHRLPWAETRHTRLDELDPLCPHDHKLKTNRGWSLVDGTGRRAFVPADDPRHPRHKPPP